MVLAVIPVKFKELHEYGDFNFMIKLEQYNDSLFIFNDNIEEHCTGKRGAGNAVIRPFNKYGVFNEYPRSAGIPTGSYTDRGFKELNDKSKKIIDLAFEEIHDLIKKHNYKRIFYSSEKDSDLVGTSLFEVDKEVLEYITDKIKNLKEI